MDNAQISLDIILTGLKKHGLTEKQFLILCDINTSFLNDWKSGKVKFPSYDKMIRIAKVLNISLDYLLTGEESLALAENVNEMELLELYRELELHKQLEFKAELRGYIKRLKEENKQITKEKSI